MVIAFLLGLITFNFILVTERILRLTKVFASVGASLGDMARILLYLQPQITVLTTPIAFLIATLLVYGRLNTDNELTVLRTSGMSFFTMVRPVFALGAACFVLAALCSFVIAPAAAGWLRATVTDIVTTRAPLAIEEGIFNTSFDKTVIYVREKPTSDTMRDIFIYDGRKKDEPTVMLARAGSISVTGESNVSFDLKDGRIHMGREGETTELTFGRYILSFPITAERPLAGYEELTPAGLLSAAANVDRAERTRILLELNRRLSLPLLSLILMVLGPPLALLAGRQGRLGGLTLGISVFAAYYVLLVWAEGLARAGKIPLVAGAWAPSLLLGLFSIWMYRRAAAR